jgi:tyrosine-specific transport protein
MHSRHFYAAIATLVGTIIGAGVLGIPYVVAKAGFLTGLLNLFVLGIAVVFLYLFMGEIVLRTRGNHQLTGYAEIYLGKWGKVLMVFAMIFGIYGALIAYIIGEGESLAAIFNSSNPLLFSMIFFVAFSLLIYRGLKAVENSELVLATFVVIIISIISIYALPKINFSNLSGFNPKLLFMPYGVILFALAGSIAIPEMKEELTHNRELIKKAIIIGALIPIFLYLFFSFVIIGANGLNTTEIATVGLSELLGQKMFIFGNVFAVLAMATSFLTLGLGLKEMYHYDYHINETLAWILTVVPPLILFFLLEKSFVGVIGLTGGIGMGLEGILIVLMYRQAKKIGARKPEYQMRKYTLLQYALILIFFLGIIYTILDFFKIL